MRIWAYLALTVAILGALSVYGYFMRESGKDSVRASLAAQIEQYRDTQARLVERLEESNAKERIVIREKIKIVRTAKDDTNCADSKIPSKIFDLL